MAITEIIKQLQQEQRRVQSELSRLDSAIQALNGAHSNGKTSSRPRGVMSAAARKKIAAAQKARWAKWRAKQKRAA